eukprot:474816-Amorphochlora_amoeboformis.AAC.1
MTRTTGLKTALAHCSPFRFICASPLPSPETEVIPGDDSQLDSPISTGNPGIRRILSNPVNPHNSKLRQWFSPLDTPCPALTYSSMNYFALDVLFRYVLYWGSVDRYTIFTTVGGLGICWPLDVANDVVTSGLVYTGERWVFLGDSQCNSDCSWREEDI